MDNQEMASPTTALQNRVNGLTTHLPHTASVDGSPYDVLAAEYDRFFSESLLGSLLREAVHQELAGAFEAGDRVLDLGCGTGEDALRLAAAGAAVYAVDRSSEMLKSARAKTRGLSVDFKAADIEHLDLAFPGGTFDGVLSDFGALNSVRDRGRLARELARLVRPGGRVFLVVMGRWCPWEWMWYVSRGMVRTALRRLGGTAGSMVGPVYYPSPIELAAEFADGFEWVRTAGIGVLLPPTYASSFVQAHPRFFRRAARLERRIRHSRPAAAFNDHYLLELRRRDEAPQHIFACPSCGESLTSGVPAGSLYCTREDAAFEHRDGILDLVAADRAEAFEQFVSEYDDVRRAEGRGSDSSEYYRALPYADPTGRFARDWKIRAASFRSLLADVVEPLEREKGELRILDLGAGSGWLAYRLAQRGHDAVAVDLRTGRLDGLGAHIHFDAPFIPVRAEFDRLPFADGSFDLVVFNASFHYSEKYDRTLGEALRVLAGTGRIAIIDSPIYRKSFSGSWMVAARERAFEEQYGFRSNSIRSEHFLTPARLQQLSAETGVTWTIHRPRYGLRWALRPLVAQLRRGCEPARFAVIEGRPHLNVEAEVRSARPAAPSIGRVYQRARRLVTIRKDTPRTIEANGLRLEIAPGVFDPLLFRSGVLLANVVRRMDLEGRSVLDLGCGSGIGAIVASLWGARVTATDVSRRAIGCTARNARAYAADLEVRRSDLFDNLVNRRFDIILFNPPYFRGAPADDADRAWRSPNIIDRFARELSGHLNENGFALVVLSSDGACPDYLRTFDRAGFRMARVVQRRFANETLTVYRVAP